MWLGFPSGLDGKESACNATGLGLIPQRREWQLTLVFLPEKFHREGSLAGYSPWGWKEWDATEQWTLSLSCNDCKCYK